MLLFSIEFLYSGMACKTSVSPPPCFLCPKKKIMCFCMCLITSATKLADWYIIIIFCILQHTHLLPRCPSVCLRNSSSKLFWKGYKACSNSFGITGYIYNWERGSEIKMVSRTNSFRFYYQLVSPVAKMLCFLSICCINNWHFKTVLCLCQYSVLINPPCFTSLEFEEWALYNRT